MIWPPVKAWTKKLNLKGHVHFIAINYGGELQSRWVILMSVLDSTVVIKVPWSQLIDLSNWEAGWDERNYIESSNSGDDKSDLRTIKFSHPSIDSGLTIPITEDSIRPWFNKI